MITPQSANFTTLLSLYEGRGFRLLAHIEGLTDPVCNVTPADAWSKTSSIAATGTTSPLTNYVYCGQDAALTALPEWTVVAWVKQPSGGGGGHVIGAWYELGPKGWRLENAGGYYRARWTGGYLDCSTAAIANNTWEYIAVSVGGTDQTVVRCVHVDTDYGPFYDSDTYATRNVFEASAAFNMFSNISGGGVSGIAGAIGYAAVFNRALTHREMRAIKYRRIDKKLGNDDSEGLWDDCVAEWRMERVANGYEVVNDRNPGTHDALLYGDAAMSAVAPFTVTYRPVLAAGLSTGQSIDPLATRTSIQSTTLRLLDADEWLTRVLQSTNLGLMRKGVRVYLGFDGLLESEYQPVFNGQIGDVSYDAHVYDLEVRDALFGAKQKITLGKGTLGAGINAVVTTCQVETARYFEVSNDSPSAVIAGYIKIDDEYIKVPDVAAVSASLQQLGTGGSPLVRARFSSTAATHSAGAAIREVISFGTSNPLYSALMFLLSSGGWQSTSTWDMLLETAYTDATTRARRARGGNLSPSDVAVAEIVALAALTTQNELYVEDDIEDVKDFTESEILRGAGCYYFVKSDGRLSVGRLAVPTTSDVVRTLDPDRFLRARMSATEGEVVNYVDVSYDYNVLTGKFEGFLVNTDATSGAKYGLRKRTYELGGVISSADLTTVTGWILQRFKNPYVTFTVECGLYEFLLEIGDAVYLQDRHLPNLSTGYRGVTKLLCQVIGRKFDLGTGRVQLTLVDCSRM